MAWHLDKSSGELIFDGVEKGIGNSPHTGIGNLQNGNINTETGEIMANYIRTQQSQGAISGGTFNAENSSTVVYGGNPSLLVGSWVDITASTISGLSTGYYYIISEPAHDNYRFSTSYGGSVVTGLGSTGTATFNTVSMNQPIQSATEIYFDSSQNEQYRYYIVDVKGYLWFIDTGVSSTQWFIGASGSDITTTYGANISGLAVLNGVVLMFVGNSIYYKKTVLLGTTWAIMTQSLNNWKSFNTPHYAITNHNGWVFYCDNNYIGQIIASSVSSAGNINIWSYGIATVTNASPSIFTITQQIGGNFVVNGATITFDVSQGGSLSGFSTDTVYYVINSNKTSGTFEISSSVAGSALNSLSVTGTLYFNTFDPNAATSVTYTIVQQALTLGVNEITQTLVELGSNLFIGCVSNNIYNWNETAIAGGGTLTLIQLPESNTSSFVQANDVAYIFVGNKGNIYVTNGSSVSLAITMSDYCAGIAGIPSSYVDPIFIWSGTMFLRGRIWFSIQDQTSTKTGNCGGIWSFVPSFFNPVSGQDTGLSLRMENTNSYGTLNGSAVLLIPAINQDVIGPQYWSAWNSNINSPSYAIDGSGTVPVTTVTIETDILQTGTILSKQKKTYENIQYQSAVPLALAENIAINYRLNRSDAWASAGTINAENSLMGYVSPVKFQSTQWLQFQIILTTNGNASTSSFVPFSRLILT